MPNITYLPREVAFINFLGKEQVQILAQNARAAAEKAGLSTATLSIVDLATLRNYTGLTQTHTGERNHQQINRALRNENRAELIRLAPLIATLEAALAKLPNHVGDVVRATDLPENVANHIVPGGTYSDAGFMSTAIGETGFKGKYMFYIKSRTGKWIEPFSFYPEQKEVLYPPEKEFTIKDVEEGLNNKIKVWLEEV
ncbi:MAG: ADP-ribosyltransferase [Magnetococcus sp. DMHC-1]|nr:hypothetical protein [Magnetococcales bacterium]